MQSGRALPFAPHAGDGPVPALHPPRAGCYHAPMTLFALATLLPLGLVALGAVAGGPWALLALLAMTLLTATLDRLARAVPATGSNSGPATGPDAEFPGGDALLAAVALGQIVVVVLATRALAGEALGPWGKGALFAALGLWAGQVGNAAAHELIHRPSRALRRLGVAAYASVLFGHHASAHPLVHHVHGATRQDPATARLGEPFWRYAPRAWRGSFRKGLRAETERGRRANRPAWRHPYLGYGLLSLLALAASALVGGAAGVLWHLALAALAQGQLLLSDYVQHYGLLRAPRPDGRPEPMGPRHSWNSPHPASSAMLLNVPRHSDHHVSPLRPFPALRLPAEAPTLPRSLPAMACLALVPPLWHRVMDPRAREWLARP